MRTILIVAALLFFVTSCNASHTAELPAPGSQPPAGLDAIPFPGGGSPDRTVSNFDQLWVYGRRAYLEGGDTLTVGDTMVLSAGPGELTWSIYELYPGAFPFDQVYTNLSDVSFPENVWIGIANYARNAWDWHPADDASPALPVAGRDLISPGGGLYLCVASWNDTSATVHKVYVEVDVPEWGRYPINPFGVSGQLHSMALIGDKPAILVQDPTSSGDYDMFYYQATEQLPASGEWSHSAVQTGYADSYQALKLIDCGGGRPAFASIDAAGQLYYRHSSDIPPISAVSWQPSFVATTVSRELGLDMADSHPAVAYIAESTHGGEKVMYARADAPLPILPDWSYWTIAETLSPTQAYEGLGLATLQDEFPCVAYYNDSAHLLYFWTSDVALPTGPANVVTAMVDNPPLGGATWPRVINYQGHASIIYDTVNSVIPRYARASSQRPEHPGEFESRHLVSHMSADMPAVAARQTEIGIAFRDYRDGSIKYAWFDTDDPTGDGVLNSGADWRIVTVDERQTEGAIGLIFQTWGIPEVSYTVSADGLLYIAHRVPTS